VVGKDIDDTAKRHDQLTTAPKSGEADAEPRFENRPERGATR
jgi:hypothetical protein